VRDRLLADDAFQRARRVGLYAALPDEIPTVPLFEALVAAGRTCLFPRARGRRALEYAPVHRLEDLRPGRFGVREPPADGITPLDAEDVVIVPGVAFDRRGYRLGRGAGYYDRTFPPGEPRRPRLLGVIWSDRLLDSLPHDSHDCGMDAIVTDREWVETRGSG